MITERAFKIGVCYFTKVRRSLPTKSEDLPMNCYRKQQQTNDKCEFKHNAYANDK